jgi:hypothetical protein
MSECKHKSCGCSEKVWMTYYFDGRDQGLKTHFHCTQCGLIKNSSSDRPRSIGFFMNLVTELGKHHKIAQVQIRLINQEMEKLGIDDSYGFERKQQEKLFVKIATMILNVSEREILELL